jgi:hypothetical protein
MKFKLTDIAEVIRSKNSGPYELTLDVIFRDWDTFGRACRAKAFSPALVSRLYNVPEDKIINIVEFKPAKAVKITIVRPIASGDLGETDVYGAQQHAPLLGLELDI